MLENTTMDVTVCPFPLPFNPFSILCLHFCLQSFFFFQTIVQTKSLYLDFVLRWCHLQFLFLIQIVSSSGSGIIPACVSLLYLSFHMIKSIKKVSESEEGLCRDLALLHTLRGNAKYATLL